MATGAMVGERGTTGSSFYHIIALIPAKLSGPLSFENLDNFPCH
jgi:hypothetical protein